MKPFDESLSKEVEIIDWCPDKSLEIPIYKQIVEYIKCKVINGDWVLNSRLPSQRKLAELFKVNRSTIVMAMDELCSYGILQGSSGGGTRVASNTWSFFMSNNTPDWGEYIDSGIFKANKPIIQTINKLEYDDNYIRLGTGELSPKLLPSHIMKEIFSRLPEKLTSLNYLEPLGLFDLRKIICDRLKLKGINVSPSCVLITSGSLQAIHLLSVCVLKKGSTLYTENLSYIQSLKVFQSAGINLCGIPMDKEGIEYFKIPIKNNNARSALLYTIPTFHNPTGNIMSEERREKLYSYCKKNMLPIIEDDVYGELWFDEVPPKPLKAIDNNGMIIYLGSISKSLAPGFRIGWLVGPESVVQKLGDAKMQMDYGASSIAQYVMFELLSSGLYDKYLSKVRIQLKKRRNLMISILEKEFKDIATWTVPKGGFYIWITFNNRINTEKLFQKAVENKLLINPGSIYGCSNKHSLRLSYAYADEEDIIKGIELLSSLINEEK